MVIIMEIQKGLVQRKYRIKEHLPVISDQENKGRHKPWEIKENHLPK